MAPALPVFGAVRRLDKLPQAASLVSSHHTEEIVTNCHRFYMLAHQRIEPFGNGEAFLTRYSAKSYDEAFINAAM